MAIGPTFTKSLAESTAIVCAYAFERFPACKSSAFLLRHKSQMDALIQFA